MALLKYCILLYMFTFITCTEIEDPCDKAKTLDDDGTRRRSCSYSTGKCDRYLTPGWYRVRLASNDEEDLMMPTEPPTIDSCGTHYPIWLDGEHPVVADGIVDRIACSRYMNTTCYIKYPIKIKNCTSHMVYYLVRAKGCNERYCFENDNDLDDKCGPASQSNLTTTATPTAAPITSTTAQSKSTTMLSSSTTAPKTSTTPPGTSTITLFTTTQRPKTPVATTTSATTSATTVTTTTSATTIFNNRLANNGNGRSNQYISENINLSDKDDDGVSISAFIGMAVLSVFLIVVVGLLILYMIIKKRKRNRGNLEKYIIFEPTLNQNCKNI